MLTYFLALVPEIAVSQWTASVRVDADDPAIVYRGSRSLIIGTDKTEKPAGGLFVFDLKGKVVHSVTGLDRPNNVDVVQAFPFGKSTGALVVTTERLANRLRCFRVSEFGHLIDVTGVTRVFRGVANPEPMGIACLQTSQGAFAVVSQKTSPKVGHLEKGRLSWNPVTKKVDYLSESRFGRFSGIKETESLVVDQATQIVYWSDETVGIWRSWLQQPEQCDFRSNSEHTGDHEGLAIWNSFLVSTDQRPGRSVFWVYDKSSLLKRGSFSLPTDDTDGIEILPKPMGSRYPEGIMVAMSSKQKNFAIVDLRLIRSKLGLKPF